MKILKIVIFSLVLLLIYSLFVKKDDEIIVVAENPSSPQAVDYSSDIDDILYNFFSENLPVTDLIIGISGENIEISGTIDKKEVETYLKQADLLDFKTSLGLSVLPQTVCVKFFLSAKTTNEQFSLTATKIEIENFSLDTNFLLYSIKI